MGPSITLNLGEILTWIIIGVVAGSLAGALVRGRRFGFWTSLLTGLIGAVVGGFLFKLVNVPISPELQDGVLIRWIDIIVAFVGAVIVLLLLGLLWGFRRR